MKPSKLTRAATLQRRIADQRRWIDEHGGSQAGYVARYGSRDDAQHYGDGGEAIYAADTAALRAMLGKVAS